MNDWTWHHVYGAEAAMEEMAGLWADDLDPRLGDLLKQFGRSLFPLEASDWQFLITTFSARDYAELRLTLHNDDICRLAAMTRRYAAERELPAEDWNFSNSAGNGMIFFRIWTRNGGPGCSIRPWKPNRGTFLWFFCHSAARSCGFSATGRPRFYPGVAAGAPKKLYKWLVSIQSSPVRRAGGTLVRGLHIGLVGEL